MEADPQAQLDGFIDKFTPEIAAVTRDVLGRMRERLPGAYQLVYDNYNALVIGFGPSERSSEAIFSIAAFPRWVSLFFLHGAKLEDPARLLKGSGNQARHIVLTRPELLEDPAILDLMHMALSQAEGRINEKTDGRLIIKSISARQRPRRPAGPSSRRNARKDP